MTQIAITKRQRDLMRHALGLDRRNRKSYRNYFCASFGSPDDVEIQVLIGLGLMVRGPAINDGREYYAYVTDLGKSEVLVDGETA